MTFTGADLADLTVILRLAAETEDLSPAERRALQRIAGRVDRQTNVQMSHNPALPKTLGPTPACTYSSDHPKSCPCRTTGLAWEPTSGWSRLAEEFACPT